MLKMAKEFKEAKHDKPKKKVKKERTIDLDKAYGAHKKKKGFFTKIKEAFVKMSKGKRAIVISLISVITVLVLLLGTAFGYGCFLYCDIKGSYNYNNEVDDDQELQNIKPINEEVTNIALFGIDSRKVGSFKGLSDSIMILSLNNKTGKIKLISVMRDSLVEIPGKGDRKINSAYSIGGPALAIKTLNHNFGLDIKEYATVNFYGMAEIVDAVGGIEIDVKEAEINASKGLNSNIREQCKHMGVSADKYLVKKSGKQKLNGVQAVAWARIRSVSTDVSGQANDYGRTDRQRYVMEQLLNSVKGLDLTKYPALAKKIVKHMETSLHFDNELIPLVMNMFSKEITFEQTRVPQNEFVISDRYNISYLGWTVYYNLEYATDLIHAFIYDNITPEDYMEQNGINKDGWHSGGNIAGSGGGSGSGSGSGSGGGSGSGDTSSDVTSSGSDASSDITSSDVTSSGDTSSDVTSSGDTSSDVTSSGDTSSDVTSSDTTSSDAASSEPPPSGGGGSGSGDTSSDEASSLPPPGL